MLHPRKAACPSIAKCELGYLEQQAMKTAKGCNQACRLWKLHLQPSWTFLFTEVHLQLRRAYRTEYHIAQGNKLISRRTESFWHALVNVGDASQAMGRALLSRLPKIWR